MWKLCLKYSGKLKISPSRIKEVKMGCHWISPGQLQPQPSFTHSWWEEEVKGKKPFPSPPPHRKSPRIFIWVVGQGHRSRTMRHFSSRSSAQKLWLILGSVHTWVQHWDDTGIPYHRADESRRSVCCPASCVCIWEGSRWWLSAWTAPCRVGDQDEFLLLALARPRHSHYSHLGSEPSNETSLSPLRYSNFPKIKLFLKKINGHKPIYSYTACIMKLFTCL